MSSFKHHETIVAFAERSEKQRETHRDNVLDWRPAFFWEIRENDFDENPDQNALPRRRAAAVSVVSTIERKIALSTTTYFYTRFVKRFFRNVRRLFRTSLCCVAFARS